MVNCFPKKQKQQKTPIIEHRCYICNTKIPIIFIDIMRLCKCEYFFVLNMVFQNIIIVLMIIKQKKEKN